MATALPTLDLATQRDRAKSFAALHRSAPLVLPNAWDAGTARLIERAGATAIATTSGGCAWSLGYPDGDRLPRNLAVGAIRAIASTTSLPVSADIERGYGASLPELEATIVEVLAAGAVGINLEDSGGDPLYAPEQQAERIATVRRAADRFGVPLFINARTDVFLLGVGAEGGRLDDVIHRAGIYADTGADGFFVPGLLDLDALRTLTRAIRLPVNAMVGPGAPPVTALVDAGVTRISAGTAIAQATYAVVQRAARELLTSGTYASLHDALDYADLNALFTR